MTHQQTASTTFATNKDLAVLNWDLTIIACCAMNTNLFLHAGVYACRVLQMHIHLARVFTSVHTTIAYASWNLKLTRFDLDCGPNKGSTIKLGELTECKIAETTSTNPKYTVRNSTFFTVRKRHS
jgi:hypothetical protein